MCPGNRNYMYMGAPWKCYKVFCALVVTVKCSVDQLRMHHFSFSQYLSAPGGFTPRPRFHPWTPLETFLSRSPNLPPLEEMLRVAGYEHVTLSYM